MQPDQPYGLVSQAEPQQSSGQKSASLTSSCMAW